MIRKMTATITDSDRELPDIIVAAYKGDYKLVSDLLAQNVDVNTVDPRDNLSLLHIAGLQGDDALANVVLEHDRKNGDVDYSIRSHYRPRLAWQFAANGNFLALAERIDDAGLKKARPRKSFRPS